LADKESKPVDWKEVVLRVAVPGLLIALAGLTGEWALSNFSSAQENARLVTNLQIQREQAESVLRKDIFNFALPALLKEEKEVSQKSDLSKRLLKLELLSLNFGDSLSLSPFFTEFERDIRKARGSNGGDVNQNEQWSFDTLRKRLRSLATRVASAQTSALVQHGFEMKIRVPLAGDGSLANGEEKFSWPAVDAAEYRSDVERGTPEYKEVVMALSNIALGLHERYMTVSVSDPDPDEKKVKLKFQICAPQHVTQQGDCQPQKQTTVKAGFTLNLFNFPKIDNTRLSGNQRVAFVLDSFPKIEEDASIEIVISAIFFPSEYASLRDRPSMQEALDLLHQAQTKSSDKGAKQ
jgi:hypothetical protein